MNKLAFFFILSIYGSGIPQISTISGKMPQLPSDLGANGGLKVECLSGCGGSTSGTVTSTSFSATTTADEVGSSLTITKILVQNRKDNTENVLCGSSASQDILLEPGDALSMDVNNRNLIYCKTVSGTATIGVITR
jgi:hypothetical protein